MKTEQTSRDASSLLEMGLQMENMGAELDKAWQGRSIRLKAVARKAYEVRADIEPSRANRVPPAILCTANTVPQAGTCSPEFCNQRRWHQQAGDLKGATCKAHRY